MSKLMAHMVSHYPDRKRSIAVADGLLAGGASFLEIQFPFSDPTADGPVIQAACQTALKTGFSVNDGFALVEEIASKTEVPIFVMAYASVAFARGIPEFLRAGVKAGAAGFILPDLPPDYDDGAYGFARDLGTQIMPVLVTTMPETRLATIYELRPHYLYVALRSGITGTRTEIGEENLEFLKRVRSGGATVMAGFGISDREQVEVLEDHVDAVIVGSALVQRVAQVAAETAALDDQAARDEIARQMAAAIRELTQG